MATYSSRTAQDAHRHIGCLTSSVVEYEAAVPPDLEQENPRVQNGNRQRTLVSVESAKRDSAGRYKGEKSHWLLLPDTRQRQFKCCQPPTRHATGPVFRLWCISAGAGGLRREVTVTMHGQFLQSYHLIVTR